MNESRLGDRPNTPSGVATLLPADAFRHRYLEQKIIRLFSRWGYQEIIPPLFEYLDVILDALDSQAIEDSYQLPDRASGRMMVLRNDVTPQIARIASLLLTDHKLPIRLCYSSNIFRHTHEHAGRERETFQIGAELIGPDSAEADAELIELGIDAMAALEIKEFKICVSHAGFLKEILGFDTLPKATKAEVVEILQKKDLSLLAASELLPVSLKEKIRLLFKASTVEDAELLAESSGQKAFIERIRAICDILDIYKNNIILDFSEIRGPSYYTGVVFEFYAADSGSEIGAGGRYNNLLEKFGTGSPSSGFALNLEKIQKNLEFNGKMPDSSAAEMIFIFRSAELKRAKKHIIRLRSAGIRVVQMAVDTTSVVDLTSDKSFHNVRLLAADQNIDNICVYINDEDLMLFNKQKSNLLSGDSYGVDQIIEKFLIQ